MSKQAPKPTKKASQEQHIFPVSPDKVQTEVVNMLINPELKTIFDVESNKEMQVTIREPDMMLLSPEAPLIKPSEKITIFRCHIPLQLEIDRAMAELRTKVLRQLVVNIETADLIREYDKSVRFKDIYIYMCCDKLTGNSATQKKIAGEATNYVVANDLLFKIERIKEGSN